MNIAQFCIEKKTVTYVFTAILLISGIWAYTRIGRLEDPEFTIKSAQIITQYPGATAQQVMMEVTDPIEIAAQQMGQLKRVTSLSSPGRSIVTVEMQDRYGGDDLPQIWDELRNKISDMAGHLPQGASTPVVMDDYGDVYGVFYAIYGDGYSYAELKAYAKDIKRELLLCKDVAKIELLGDRQEVVYLEINRSVLATTGISPLQIQKAIAGENTAADAGNIRIGEKYIRLDPTGKFTSVEEMGDLLIAPAGSKSGASVRLRDIAAIRREYQDPPANIVRYNGHPSIGLGISTVKGGNVMVMAESIDQRIRELEQVTPIGIEFGVISHQADSVDVAVKGFVINLLEAVAIVIAVLLVAMGIQSGILIGAVLVITVMGTVLIMQQMGVLFERISLGAFIIALGMLVDNAIVITEAVLIAARKGEDKVKAAVSIVKQAQWPLLGATAVAILSFAPIGASNDSTGEYCRSLFLVLFISLTLSWVLAITVTPLLAATFLKKKDRADTAGTDPYDGKFYKIYRSFLSSCIQHRWISVCVILAMLISAGYGFTRVKQSFFPDSTRPQFMIHAWLPEGTHISVTGDRLRQIAAYAKTLEGVTDVTEMTGTGGLRFLLTYGPENANSAYGILLVDVTDYHRVDDLAARITEYAKEQMPDTLVYGQRFVLGPGDPQKIQMRIIGREPEVLREYAEKALNIMHEDPKLVEIQSDWRNRVHLIRPVVSETRARSLGVSRSDIATALKSVTTGVPVGFYKEGDETLPIVLRAPETERSDPDSLYSAWFWAPFLNQPLPLAQVVHRFENTSEEARLGRRNRSLCITVKCNTTNETAATAFKRIAPKLEAAMADLPDGYHMEWGGEHESSGNASTSLGKMIPPVLVLMVLIVVALFNSIRQPVIIFITVPLTVIGVTTGLLLFDQPFGFMALLGFLSLVGMQIKNAIVLIDEINAQNAAGVDPFQALINAGVVRLRPVVLAALTTVLGMVPLLTDAFYVAMAVTIMGGLIFATILTMVVIPLNYAIIYRVPNP